MDELYRSMGTLERKVDRLYDLVVKLDRQMGELRSRARAEQSSTANRTDEPLEPISALERAPLNPLMQHKDILLDGSEWDLPDCESYKNVSPELQIRRLTAQVTAAYGRIAALEEQLLARRVSPQS